MARARKAAEEGTGPEAGSPASPRSLVRSALWPVCASVGGTALAALFCLVLFPPPGESESAGAEAGHAEGELSLGEEHSLALPEVVVNLADEGRDAMLRVRLSMHYRAADPEHAAEEITKHTVALKDAMITHLSGKVTEQVKSSQGKELLKWELIDRLNQIVFPNPSHGKITNLFYEELLVN